MDGLLYKALLICALFFGLSSARGGRENRERYKKLERKYNELAEATGNAELATNYISEADLSEVKRLINDEKLVQAVKLVRDRTGMKLLEAKRFVDRLE